MEWRFEQYETDATWPIATGESFLVGVGSAVCCVEQNSGHLNWETPMKADIKTRPSIGEETGFVVDDSGRVYAFEVSTGAVQWSREVDANGGVPPVTDGNSVIATTSEGLVSLTTDIGEDNWECQLPSGPSGPPVLTTENVYTGTEDGVVYAISRNNGTIQWKKAVDAPLTTAGLVISEDILYIPTAPVHSETSGNISAMDTMAREICWTVDTPTRSKPTSYQVAPPVVHDGTVYLLTGVIGAENHLQAIQDGQSLWRSKVPGVVFSSPAITDDLVLIYSGRYLLAFERESGIQTWSTPIEESPYIDNETVPYGAPIITEQSIIVRGSRKLCAVSLDPEWQTEEVDTAVGVANQSAMRPADTVTGHVSAESALLRTSTVRYPSTSSRVSGDATVRWGFHSAGGHLINPMIVDDTVYLASSGGLVTALDPEEGTIRWLVQHDGKFEKCPLVANETLYLSCRDSTFALDPYDGSICSRDAAVPDSPKQPTGEVAACADDSITVGFTPDLEKVLVTVLTDKDSDEWQFEDELSGYAKVWDSYYGRIGTTLFVGLMFKPGSIVFYALDDETGSVTWRLVGDTGGGTDIFAPPILHEGRLFVTSSNHFYAIDPY